MTKTSNHVAEEIRRYVVDQFLFGLGGDQLSDNDSFLEQGIIDSTGVLELVMFLEQRFGIKVADTELVPANLGSIAHVAAFVARKSG